MVKLKTEVILPEYSAKIGYQKQSMMVGSCFTENIGNYLRELLFPVEVNPFGILYNPVSIANSLEILIKGRLLKEEELFFANGLWNSFYHHSRFSNPDKQECLGNINRKINEASEVLKECELLMITFGTSWVFEDLKSSAIVSNCHKLPSSAFQRYRLSMSTIVERWKKLISDLVEFNPSLRIIFTVSPIRHLKDGFHENQLSKSTLLMAADELQSYFGQDKILYFPSYEILLDELRDYRFYAPDMVHLSEVAIAVIREKFSAAFINKEDLHIASEVEKVIQGLNHRPSQPEEKEYRDFIDKQIERISQLQKHYPFLNTALILKQFELKKGIFNF